MNYFQQDQQYYHQNFSVFEDKIKALTSESENRKVIASTKNQSS
jgi:hypothetical protein